MKIFNKFIIALLTIAMCVNFSSCKKDENDTPNKKIRMIVSNSTKYVFTWENEMLKKFRYENLAKDYDHKPASMEITFVYNEEKLISATETTIEENGSTQTYETSFTYSGDKIVGSKSINGNEYNKYDYTYNGNYIEKITGESSDSYTWYSELVWVGDCLTKIQGNNYFIEYSFDNANNPFYSNNNTTLFVMLYLSDYMDLDSYPSKHNVTSAIFKEDIDTLIDTLSYFYDNDNYPSSVTLNGKETFEFIYE